MEKKTDPEKSLTAASRRSGVMIRVEQLGGSSSTNTRRVPYAERYRQFTGLHETPAQRIQRAAKDEAARRSAASSD